MQDAIHTLHPGQESPPTITVPLRGGTTRTLPTGSAFPQDAHPDSDWMLVATHLSGQKTPVLCQTRWGELQEFIQYVDSLNTDENTAMLVETGGKVACTTPAQASLDPQSFKDYITDLIVLLVLNRKLFGKSITVLNGDDASVLTAVSDEMPIVYLTALTL